MSITASMSASVEQNTKYQLVFYVPSKDVEAVLQAVHEAGAGRWPGGLYEECAFISTGIGTFKPTEKADPHLGVSGFRGEIDEHKIETICVGEECTIRAVQALKRAHPYEQVAYFVFKSEDI